MLRGGSRRRVRPQSPSRSGQPRLPAFLQAWLARRVAREQPASAEGVTEADFVRNDASVAALIDELNDDRLHQDPAPTDTPLLGSLGRAGAVAGRIWHLGARSLHATNPILWLAALLALATVLTAGLVFTLREFAPARAARRTAHVIAFHLRRIGMRTLSRLLLIAAASAC